MTNAACDMDVRVQADTNTDSALVSPDASPKPGLTTLSSTKSATVSALAVATAACGGGGGSGESGTTPPTSGGPTTPAPTVQKPQSDAEAARFILQASLSASDAAITSISDRGYEPWLDSEMSQTIGQTGIEWLTARGFDQIDDSRFFDSRNPGDYMVWNQLLSGTNVVRKRVALALSQFFVVSLSGLDLNWRSQAIAHYWDQLMANAFGNYRNLLEDMTLNPAMGFFLNTRGNRKADPRSGREPDENYAREALQLFSIGLVELNADGSPKSDSSGQPIETYNNDDITNLARVFTGYDWDYSGNVDTPDPRNSQRNIPSTSYVKRPMTADPSKWSRPRGESEHSPLQSNFLGVTVPAGSDAPASLKIALDAIFNHPNVGPFFAEQMIQRLVTSNPSRAYVQRVASVFDNNGSSTRGDLRAVFKAILLDDEAIGAAGLSSMTFGKVREPIIRFVQLGRTFGVQSESGNWEVRDLSDTSRALAQSPLRSPSVFNFFRPGYVPANSNTAANSLVAPEFQIINESTIPSYVNFMQRAVESRDYRVSDLIIPYTEELKLVVDQRALVDRLSLLLSGGQLSDATKSLISTALEDRVITDGSTDDDKLRRIRTAVLLVMASPEYLVQK